MTDQEYALLSNPMSVDFQNAKRDFTNLVRDLAFEENRFMFSDVAIAGLIQEATLATVSLKREWRQKIVEATVGKLHELRLMSPKK